MKGGSETTPPPHEYPCVYMVFLWVAINTTSMQYITYNSPVTFILLKYSFAWLHVQILFKYLYSVYTEPKLTLASGCNRRPWPSLNKVSLRAFWIVGDGNDVAHFGRNVSLGLFIFENNVEGKINSKKWIQCVTETMQTQLFQRLWMLSQWSFWPYFKSFFF